MPLTPRLAAALVAALALGACQADASRGGAGGAAARPAAGAPTPAVAVVATVNGAPITRAELELASRGAGRADNPHGTPAAADSAASRRAVLDQMIVDELAAQRARARGLDADPTFQQELATRQAQLDDFRRRRLAELLRRERRQQVTVSEADARRYFDEHADRIHTELRVRQLLLRDRAAAEQARRALDGGARFEDVAARALHQAGPGAAPWDVGYLRWNQIPEAWRGVVDQLAVGATSPIIEGPGGRWWIVELVDRRVEPSITFESARPTIELLLQSRAAAAAEAALEHELRAGAAIVETP
jgi:peptidyl-prolyl cis-trans isomerase C